MSDRMAAGFHGDRIARPSYRPEPDRGLSPEMRRMGVVAGGLGGAALVIFGAMAVLGGHGGYRGGRVPVIAAEPGPVRIKPLDPGGMQVAGADDGAAGEGAEKLAPPPEKPDLGHLRARTPERADKPKQIAATLIAPAPPVTHTAAIANVSVNPAASSLALRSDEKPGAITVQLATVTSEDDARAAWSELREKHPDLVRAQTPVFVKTALGRRTVWALRVGRFPSITAARAFCSQLLSHGQDCAVSAS